MCILILIDAIGHGIVNVLLYFLHSVHMNGYFLLVLDEEGFHGWQLTNVIGTCSSIMEQFDIYTYFFISEQEWTIES